MTFHNSAFRIGKIIFNVEVALPFTEYVQVLVIRLRYRRNIDIDPRLKVNSTEVFKAFFKAFATAMSLSTCNFI